MIKNSQQDRETYISVLKHDLKPPTIALIRSFELLLSESLGLLNSEQKSLLKLMLDSSHYMYFMLDTLIATYRYETNEIRLQYESFNILSLVEECIAELERLIKYTGKKVKIESKLNNIFINADRFKLKQAIYSLLANAINYSNTNSEITISINEIIECNLSKLCIKFIYRNGLVNTDSFDNLFKRYTTRKDKFNRVGAGIGLYLSKQIIEAHKGHIFVDNLNKDDKSFGFVLSR